MSSNNLVNKKINSLNYYMRHMHRNVGFFILGFVIVYGLSGIVLIYRDTDFLKHERNIHSTLPVGLNPAEVGRALRIRDFKAAKTEGDLIYFQDGSYNKTTGETFQIVKELVYPLNKLTGLHKTSSKNTLHWFTLAFGIIMLFMAVSSLWMFKSGSVLFRRGIMTILAGIIFTVILLLFLK